MSNLEIGILGFLALFLLLAIRMPVGTAMLAVGVPGIWIIHPRGGDAAIATLGGEIFSVSTVYSLTILPLFILMGNLAGISGMSRDLYDAAHAWFGHLRGGLASSTIVGCAGFSALSGSSLASAVTMGRVALPEMQRYRYDDALATGAIAAGGTLGILIPPSAGFVIYAILTEESIGRLFMAGVLPGILLSALFIATIWIGVWLKPGLRRPRPGRCLFSSGWPQSAGRPGSSVSSSSPSAASTAARSMRWRPPPSAPSCASSCASCGVRCASPK